MSDDDGGSRSNNLIVNNDLAKHRKKVEKKLRSSCSTVVVVVDMVEVIVEVKKDYKDTYWDPCIVAKTLRGGVASVRERLISELHRITNLWGKP